MPEPLMYVGMHVYFYHAGDTTKKPFVGQIQAINGSGSLDLLVFGGNAFQPRQNVYHKDSDEFTRRPQLRMSCGCWDHTPYMPRFEHPVAEEQAAKGKKKEAVSA